MYLSFKYAFVAKKDVTMPVSTVVTVTHHVPKTVKTALATYRVERALTVNLDGLECIVKQVRWLTESSFVSSYVCFATYSLNYDSPHK